MQILLSPSSGLGLAALWVALTLTGVACDDPRTVLDERPPPINFEPPPPAVDRGVIDARVPGVTGCDDCRGFECIFGLDGQRMCTTLCDPEVPDCPCGFSCQFVNNTGADSTWLCAPRPHSLCAPCGGDAECAVGDNDARCVAEQGGSFCGLGCADGCCPAGFDCVDAQCRPTAGRSCAACQDADGDGYGQGDGCAGPDCNDRDVNVHPDAVEQCNGVDDDCDSRVDEAVIAVDVDCPTAGVCAGVEPRCVDGAWDCGAPPGYEETEVRCDGLDNDCDGLVDNIADRGAPCAVGEGACAAPGVFVCDMASGDLRCAAEPLQPVAELCNGVDDDCDGVLDEIDGAGERCERGAGVCRSVGELLCDAATGEIVCTANVIEGRGEICDNRDNDCDGAIDEQLMGCVPERCNGVDDDVDGRVDEDVSQACESICGVGVETCEAGRFGGCDAPEPQAEVCNARDDDCDGRVDEGLVEACFDGPMDAVDQGPCVAGETTCRAGQWSPCAGQRLPADEACNGTDDDCDGAADEGFDVGAACEAGQGACVQAGEVGCDEGRAICLAEPGDPAPDDATCDLRDDDCDGRADEDWPGGEPACGVGACRDASAPAACVDGAVRACVPGAPAPEICNGVDDDCDAATDEGTLNACGQCGPVPVEICNAADDDCDGRADEGLANRCGGCGPEPDEICNGVDDDCDGSADEALQRPCASACGQGVERCVGAGWAACDAPAPVAEACNGQDDDCDGRVDEGTLNACGQCGAVPVEQCNGQDDDCDGRADEGTLNRCGACGLEPVEVCNRIDDDCDGQLDEGVSNRCGACGVEPDEICNGRDDDCDGRTDEALLRDCQSICGVGRETCQAGRWGQCDAPQPGVEICNDRDEDCDGRVDEGTLNACGQCGAVPNETCNGRDDDCDGRTDERVLNACGQCGAVPNEACNNRDDDCDGRTDEGVLNNCGQCGAEPNEICNNRDDDCDGRVDEGVLNACGQCGAVPNETCNGRDDDCDGRVDEGGGLCGGGDLCTQGRCCDDNDGDGHAIAGCGGGDDCDDNDRYKYPGHPEVHDIRDNDCDGDADNLGLVRLNRYYRAWSGVDWEHRFAPRRPANYESENPQHYVMVYPTNICDGARAPLDQCDRERVPGDARSAAGAIVRVRHGTLVALSICTGVLGNHHISLALTEDSGEFRGYRDESPRRLSCERLGYVYGGITWRNIVGGTAVFYRHRSGFGAAGKGDNMWSTEPREGHPLYDEHGESWRAKAGF